MQVAAFRRETVRQNEDELDRQEFLDSVASLSEDVSSMSTDVRQVLRENLALRQEVERLRTRCQGGQPTAELRRLKHQIDQLIDLHESAAARGDRGRHRRPERASRREERPRDGAWLTRMMMFMMLSELA